MILLDTNVLSEFMRPISVEDAEIAAIALTHRMALATRNTADFERIDGLELLNPWKNA